MPVPADQDGNPMDAVASVIAGTYEFHAAGGRRRFLLVTIRIRTG